jgi:hypothetical protein
MATFDLTEWQRRQNEAAEREHRTTLENIYIYENILGIPYSRPEDYLTPAAATRRLENLRRQIVRPAE